MEAHQKRGFALSQVSPQSIQATVLTTCVYNALAMLKKKESIETMTEQVMSGKIQRKYHTIFFKKRETARKWVQDFVREICTEFPVVVVDEGITGEASDPALAYTARYLYNRGKDNYWAKGMVIGLNPLLVKSMMFFMGNPKKRLLFRDYMVEFSCGIYHECAHLLITHLLEGREDTPEGEMTIPAVYNEHNKDGNLGEISSAGHSRDSHDQAVEEKTSEAGDYLEIKVFGGLVQNIPRREKYPDFPHGICLQKGVPIDDPETANIYEVSEVAMKSVLKRGRIDPVVMHRTALMSAQSRHCLSISSHPGPFTSSRICQAPIQIWQISQMKP